MSQGALTQVMAKTASSKPEKHHFGEEAAEHIEDKIMSQIGGSCWQVASPGEFDFL